jgi:hypothetical protein
MLPQLPLTRCGVFIIYCNHKNIQGVIHVEHKKFFGF